MPIAPGTRIGSFEIIAAIGAGGMGEVYRARDSKLKRDVALKVLPDTFATDADRLSRFQREAELLATLNHPNIAAIYGLEDSAGVAAIVLELVDGETLADRIARGPIPLDEALTIARQIADALEAAHDRGVVHRDLKPANIKITADGTVKVLDFGLAKMLDAAGGAPGASPTNLTFSPTLSVHATMQGVILGTAGYMSPEQARGKPVDRRTDIWAFGCVLFEMLIGRQTFAGETVTDTVAAIIKNEPDWSALPADTPPHIRALLRRCLQKDPRRRLPHIGVARLDIEEGPTELTGVGQASTPAVPARRARLLAPWLAAGGATLLAAALAIILVLRREPIDRGPVRFSVSAPEDMTFGQNVSQRGTNVPAPHFAPSPDGRRLAYVMYKENQKPQLWVRRLDALSAQALPGTDDASFPFWSPDSRFVAFFAQFKLKKIDASGGPPQTICDAPAGEGGTWNRDGVIVFAPASNGGLFRVAASGGVATPLTKLEAGRETSHGWPQFLPDGRHFLYLAISGESRIPNRAVDASRSIYAGSLDSDHRTPILQGALRSAYANGHLLFIREGTLMAQLFDATSLRLMGDPVPVAEQVAANSGNGRTAFAVSESGVLVYRNGGNPTGTALLTWFDRTGKRLGMVGAAGDYSSVALSPDGKALVVTIAGSTENFGDLWIVDLARAGIPSRLTFTPDQQKLGPMWSPDGSRIAFSSGATGQTKHIYLKKTDSAGDAEVLIESPPSTSLTSWSSDGRYIAFNQTGPKTNFDVWLLPLFGDRKPVPFLQTAFNESFATFSPDGRWIAYVSDKGGTNDVYIRAFPTSDREWRISQSGGTFPQWRADGKELFYVEPQLRAMMAVPIKSGSTLEPGQPVRLFEFPLLRNGGVRQYAVAADGQRLLIIEPQAATQSASGSPIVVVLNWASGIRN